MSHPQSSYIHTTLVGDTVLSRRRATIAKVAMLEQLDRLKKTGRYDCFKLQWHPIYDDKSMWPVPFHLFWDSDVAKWIESACYFLHNEYDVRLDHAVRELVEMIRGAQQPDGYLNVHYTVVEPKRKWSNLRDMHELYNAGHLIEAAIAHRSYYKNDLLLEPIIKYVSLIRKIFGSKEDQLHGYPGHPEIEMALLRLYNLTHSDEAYDLARYFIEERGNPSGQYGMNYFDWEAQNRQESPYTRPNTYPEKDAHWYCQSHKPILDQDTVEGHSVRAVYLLTAVADMVQLHHSGQKSLDRVTDWSSALLRLWNNMIQKKMYVTGGVGAIKQWEGFGINYFLPVSTDEGGCYAETCASIGVMMLAERILSFDLDSKFADVMELCLYNNVMTAMSLDGKKFTYINQLASSDKDKSTRENWFWCACCPPNLSRLFGSIGGYIWTFQEDYSGCSINVHLYTTALMSYDTKSGDKISLEQSSNWPWDGKVVFHLSANTAQDITIRLRLPSWCNGQYMLDPAPENDQITVEKGYAVLSPAYTNANNRFSVEVGGFEPRYIAPHPNAQQQVLGIARGPIIYCMEDHDNTWACSHFRNVALKYGETITEQTQVMHSSENYVKLQTKCYVSLDTSFDAMDGPVFEPQLLPDSKEEEAVFVPYFLRANRGGNGEMRVLFPRA
ncbi:hypothetical protein Golomagni_05932 [Golovinomyces magnicellulatus]|nr:hypothetical protein Golomagni_05932 [Golovinomyces magnicellulatus]